MRFATLIAILIFFSACYKDYSFERSDIPPMVEDSSIVTDPPPTAASPLPGCDFCSVNQQPTEISWSFGIDGSFLCGNVTSSVMSNEKDALTFFGPSSCSNDSGLIITAYFSKRPLRGDAAYVQADRASAIYYDNISDVPLFESLPQNGFFLVINEYDQSTGIAFGTMGGKAKFKDGSTWTIKNGRFRISINP